MYTFSDESGRFEESSNSDIGVISIVSITDSALKKFIDFLNNTFSNKAVDLKGSNLVFTDREKIIRYIGNHPEIKFSTFVYDHKATSKTAIKDHQIRQIRKANESIEKLKPIALFPTLVPDVELARNQLKKLSPADYLKVVLNVIAFQDWQKSFLFDFINIPKERDSWEFHHILDTQNKANTFPRLVYFLLMGSSNQLSPTPPIMNFPEKWNSDHPFIKIYTAEEDDKAIDLRKFYSDFKCKDDREELGLKLPDIIANTLFHSITHPTDRAYLKLLKKLWPNRSIIHDLNGRRNYYKVIIFPGGDETKPFATDPIQTHWSNLSSIIPTKS